MSGSLEGMSAAVAIRRVREGEPVAVETAHQIQFLEQFEQWSRSRNP